MSLSDNLKLIIDAIHDRRTTHEMAHELNKENSKDQEKETIVNSITAEMMNLFSLAEEKAQASKIELEGIRIEPKKVNKKIEGTIKDPKILFKAMKLNKDFNLMFDVVESVNEKGNEQYVIKKKKFKIK